MQPLTRRLSDALRGIAWWIDYILFSIDCIFFKKPIPEHVKKILLVEMLYIGDLLVITPTIRALKEKFPGVRIEVMTRPSMKDVLSNNPSVDYILTYTSDEIRENFKDVAYRLEMEKYDMAVLLHPGIEYGNWVISKLLWKAKIPFRVGCTRVGFLEGKGYFMHRKTKPNFTLKHKVEDNLDVVRTIWADTEDKRLEAYLSGEARKNIARFLKRHDIKKEDFVIIIHPIPRHITHRWVNERFAEAADHLTRKYNAKVIFTGAERDDELINNIINQMNKKPIKAVGLPMKEFFAIIKRGNLVISVDTSAVHVASAFNRPVIALFGAGNPKIWHPISDKTVVIYKNKVCTSCMKHSCRFLKWPFANEKRAYECMKAISVRDVLDAVKGIMKQKVYNTKGI